MHGVRTSLVLTTCGTHVFGATGQQGGSAIDFVFKDPKLSKEFKVRAITRDASKPESQALKKKASIKKAVEGAHTVFAVTMSIYDRAKARDEVAQGKAIADASVATGAKYLIFSSMKSITKHSNGKLTNCTLFDMKAEVEDLDQNGDGTYTLANVYNPYTQLPMIDVAADTGKWIGAILSDPDQYDGKFFAAAVRTYSLNEIVEILSKATGKTVKYKQVPPEVYKKFLPEGIAEAICQMHQFSTEFAYYGPEQAELVEWTVKQAKGKLTTLEEYLEKNPLDLE
ncbi:NmrA family transcriptional regulator [Tothia fuscella]|uniref:NmrA family transcriptional regulator n=1 Tax=Tothia fuscella TaxID=1048955 RepID=A0A9P4P2B4_9PEZI|nr:NmrA family transcriptional regulator [Tothia fuscella]